MRPYMLAVCFLTCVMMATSTVFAEQKANVVKLVYQEIEQGLDPYRVTYTVSSDYLRIDDESDDSGFIVYIIKAGKIFSVSHFDKSILVIAESPLADFDPDFEVKISFTPIAGAPKIANRAVYNYRVKAVTGVTSEDCMDIQLVPGLLPDVAKSLQAFQRTMSSQHAKNLSKTPEALRSPCYLVDQVHNRGDYYSKGLPVMEWHSNGKVRQLMNFEETQVDASIFALPSEYRQFSLQ